MVFITSSLYTAKSTPVPMKDVSKAKEDHSYVYVW